MNAVVYKSFKVITFKVEKDGGQFHAFCPELKGCHTFGSNPDEALKNLKSAVSLYLDQEMEEQTMNDLINEAKRDVKI